MFLGQVCFWSPINRYNISQPGSGSQGLLLHASPTHTHTRTLFITQPNHNFAVVAPAWCLRSPRENHLSCQPTAGPTRRFWVRFQPQAWQYWLCFCFSPRLARHICVLLARSVDIHVAGVMLLAILGILISKTRAEKVKFRFVFRETTYDLMIVWSCFP